MTLVLRFGPNPQFCSFDLDLDQAEQKFERLQAETQKVLFQSET